MRRLLVAVMVPLAVLVTLPVTGGPVTAATPATPDEAIARFQTGWKSRREYLRPLDDDGWKARMAALSILVGAGSQAVPPLLEAMASDDDDLRALATQALGLIGDPSAVETLDHVQNWDRSAAARLYAMDALTRCDELSYPRLKWLQRISMVDANPDVRREALFVMKRGAIETDPTVAQRAFREFGKSTRPIVAPGQPAPQFTLADGAGNPVRLTDYLGRERLVLVFVYGPMSRTCRRQLDQLRRHAAQFRRQNARVLVIDPHTVERVRLAWPPADQDADERVVVVADPFHTVSATWGVAFQMTLYTEWSNRPATFVVDRDGVIRYERRAAMNADRPTPSEILHELAELKPKPPNPGDNRVAEPDDPSSP